MRLFPETSVFVAAVVADEAGSLASQALLATSGVELWTSDLVRLETLSKLRRMQRPGVGVRERAFFITQAQFLFETVDRWEPMSQSIVMDSVQIVLETNGIGPMDAMHAATARRIGAELVTLEGPTKPFFGVKGLVCRSLAASARSGGTGAKRLTP